MSRRATAVASLVLATVLVLLPACSRAPGRGPAVTAEFARGTGLYPGSPVRLLGIDIGSITTVRNVDGHVQVRMQLDEGVRLPADVKATIVPLTLLGERYVQFGPSYEGGPRLRDGDRIPLARTSVPAEIDDLLRGLQDFMGAIDPERAGDVVTNLAEVLDGRGADVNHLIANASGTLDLLADEGDDIKAIIGSLRDLTATLEGRTDSIESLIRNYDLVTQVLVDNKGDLDGVITQLDRATVELTSLLKAHEDPLREDVKILATASGTVAANTGNIELTLASTVKLFKAAGRAYEARTNALRINNQLSPELTSDLLAGRLRDRIAGLCRRLGIPACSDPASPLLNDIAKLLPGILQGSDKATGEGPGTTPAPAEPPAPSVPVPAIPSQAELLDELAKQLTDGLGDPARLLLEALDGERLAALLGVDPILLQILNDLDAAQVERLRKAEPEEIADVMLELYNEVLTPAERLDQPLLPPRTKPPSSTPTLPPGTTPTVPPIDVSPLLGGR
ncbi:MAG: MCE-family protein Mce1D [Ilumatobacteraceae bacterium]|nr:MCE-family protein Mce1D [Ilumatobacteraceae bacterium]